MPNCSLVMWQDVQTFATAEKALADIEPTVDIDRLHFEFVQERNLPLFFRGRATNQRNLMVELTEEQLVELILLMPDEESMDITKEFIEDARRPDE